MKHAKLFAVLVGVILLGYGAVGFYFLPLASFQGDLTRTGLLPETQFGWRKPQPAMDINWMQQATWAQADVLVIGDSFSDGRVWQTVLTQQGLKVHTESWDAMRGICADFTPWLRAQGFVGKYVVLESIERNVPEILAKSVSCDKMQTHPSLRADTPRTPPAVSFDPDERNYDGRLSIGIKVMNSYQQYERLSSSPSFKPTILPSGIKVARIEYGCELFSHTRCNDALFLGGDKAEEIEASALKNIEILNSRMAGFAPIWTFVPNKSTTYLYPNKQFWNQTEQRVHAPNLLRMSQQAIQAKTIDLYPANNTHFSTTGYLLMGKEISKTMQDAANQSLPH
ncbi:MAG: hypothetical protein PHI11_01125 [Gallionella sp.]|nr:hypothetical protein [Gallionella sp.]